MVRFVAKASEVEKPFLSYAFIPCHLPSLLSTKDSSNIFVIFVVAVAVVTVLCVAELASNTAPEGFYGYELTGPCENRCLFQRKATGRRNHKLIPGLAHHSCLMWWEDRWMLQHYLSTCQWSLFQLANHGFLHCTPHPHTQYGIEV